MKTVRDIPKLDNIPVLVRAALNMTVVNGQVATLFRLKRALPTINYLRSKHARVVLIGHIGEQGTETLQPVYEAMQTLLPRIQFCPASTGPDARAAVRALSAGDVLMLENLRRNAGEVKNDKAFAAELAELADVFVEDSFDALHREHASIVTLPKLLPAYAGLLVEQEVAELSKALSPASPSLAIMGGAKFSTKEPVIKKLLASYDQVFVGGAIANDLMKAAGHPIGSSLSSGADLDHLKEVLKNPKLILPRDYILAPLGSKRNAGRIAGVDDVKEGEAILDNGPETVATIGSVAQSVKTILWNGPLGNYENGFTDGTEALAKVIATSSAHTIVGGGDTVAAIEKLNLNDQFSFISTGGGAMLDFLAKGTLPGLTALG